MKRRKRPQVKINIGELDQILDQARSVPLSDPDHAKVKTALHALADFLQNRRPSSEKTAIVAPPAQAIPDQESSPVPAPPGHGRHAAAEFEGATRVAVPHPTLHRGDRCPECGSGKVYPICEPATLVRLTGQAPLAATVYELERLRCNGCSEVFAATPPAGVSPDKFDEPAMAMIALLKYGSGMPFARLERLEQNLGIPLPSSTQWDVVEEASDLLKPARDELIRVAAQGELLHNDDTSMRILKLERPPEDVRTGVFTSGIVSEGRYRIALFFTGSQHAGENVGDVLRQRAAELPPPVLMCDALARNVPVGVAVLLANCMAHGRRQFVEVTDNFPQECLFVLETLGEVYGFDETARNLGLPAGERLTFHQQNSGPLMEKLKKWCDSQLAERKTEPNSGLGRAIRYMLNHWTKLTLFLRKAGAPLDNNICERALKRAVLHRKNALFYRTMHGADVGDLFMGLIHTCELNGVNAFEYLTALLRHAPELRVAPADWMPWNFTAAIARLAA